jgi:hypothetical protein
MCFMHSGLSLNPGVTRSKAFSSRYQGRTIHVYILYIRKRKTEKKKKKEEDSEPDIRRDGLSNQPNYQKPKSNIRRDGPSTAH